MLSFVYISMTRLIIKEQIAIFKASNYTASFFIQAVI